MRAAQASEVNEDTHAFDAEDAASIQLHDASDAPFGQRLCAAREKRGWSRMDVATRLKLPAQLIARLEGDDYAGLTEGVFLRGYLGSYARLVGIPVELANRVAAANTHAAPLVATGTISRSRYLFERYSVSATYLVLTAIIVVPAVWLATHGGLEQNLARTTPLDPPAQIVAAAPAHDTSTSMADAQGAASQSPSGMPADIGAATPNAPAQVDQSPIIASMAPFTSAPSAVPQAPSTSTSPQTASAAGSGAHTLTLKLNEQSWVEVTAADGRKLEYGMLAAHSEHAYRSDGPVSVRIGNAQGAEVRADGTTVDLTPYQRSNVATVRLFTNAGPGANRVDQ